MIDITVSSPSISLSVLSDPFGSNHLPILITTPCNVYLHVHFTLIKTPLPDSTSVQLTVGELAVQ
ncbi:hypothetical protein QTP88_019571 [Uroleucon formosanum]